MKRVKDAFDERAAALDGLLGVGRSFDMIGRTLRIGGRRARLWVVNGYADDTVLERAISAWLPIPSLEDVGTLQAFADRYVSVCDAAVETDRLKAVTAVFAGKTLLIIDGFSGGVVLDAKQFPLRSVEEPDTSKVLRGSHDGFGESVMKNAALLRRRIRDPQLTLESLQVGTRSRTDVVLCYMDNRVDRKLLDQLRKKLEAMDVGSTAMSQESVAEAIAPPQWWNPFPKTRYTERPDVAAASVLEGDILLMIDNTPAVMLLPCSLFRFLAAGGDVSADRPGHRAASYTIRDAAVVSAGEVAGYPSPEPALSPDRGRVLCAADPAAAAGGVHHRRAEAGLPQHAGRAQQLLQYAGSTDLRRLCGAGPVAGTGGTGIYGLRGHRQLRPAQLRDGLRREAVPHGAAAAHLAV